MSRTNEAAKLSANSDRWVKITKLGEKMLEDGEVVVSLRYNHKSKSVEVAGPDHMQGFFLRVADDFLETAIRPNAPSSIPNGISCVDIENANAHNIRKVTSDIVGTDVFNRTGIKRGYYGIRNLAPVWYPADVSFVSPNDNKSGKRLTREECCKVVTAYKEYVLKGSRLPEIEAQPEPSQHIQVTNITDHSYSHPPEASSEDSNGSDVSTLIKRKITELEDQGQRCLLPAAGLQNPPGKNLCFANSLIQCLRIADIHRVLEFHTDCDEEDCFTCALKTFFTDGYQTVEPLCEMMTDVWTDYSVGQQQDSHELLKRISDEILMKCFQNRNAPSDLQRLFFGKQHSIVTCNHCKTESVTVETFADLSLSINQATSVNQALINFFSNEEIEYKCLKCTKGKDAKKCVKLEFTPTNIIIQLKRFKDNMTKDMRRIDVPITLRLNNFLLDGVMIENEPSLYAVIVHKGRTVSTGHYYSFIRFGGSWYRVDDTQVEPVLYMHVMKCEGEPYLLFYRTD